MRLIGRASITGPRGRSAPWIRFVFNRVGRQSRWSVDQANDRVVFGHGVVAASLKCRQCGYELRGLNAAGLCPECGLSIWASVQHAADPEGARQPMIRNPKAVGGGLLWLMSLSFIASLLWVISDVFYLLDRLDPGGARFRQWTPPHPRVIASVLLLLAVGGVWRLSPPRRAAETGLVRRDIRLLAVGLIFAGLSMLELAYATSLQGRLADGWQPLFQPVITLSLMFFMLIALIGLHGVLRLIGKRSRQYRTARDSRQNVNGLMAVLGFIAIGTLLEQVPTHWPGGNVWPNIGGVLVAISYVMLVVGLGYLTVNALWIRRALRRQPPTLDELLLPPLPPDSRIEHPRLPELDEQAERAERDRQAPVRDGDGLADGAAGGATRSTSRPQ